MSKPDIKQTLEKLKFEVDEIVQQAYIDGFNAGSATDKPTQAEFDEAHKEPISYGEDGEIYVMGSNLSEDQALYHFKKLFDKEMFDYGDVEDLVNHIHLTQVSYIPEYISSEPGYYYRGDGSGAYKAWVWTA